MRRRHVRLRRNEPMLALAVLVALIALLAACGGGGGGGGGSGKTADATATGTVTVDAFDIHFDVGTIKAAPGPLEVTLVEKGSLEHTFLIKGTDFKLAVTSSNKTDSGTVTLKKGDLQVLLRHPRPRGPGHARRDRRRMTVHRRAPAPDVE